VDFCPILKFTPIWFNPIRKQEAAATAADPKNKANIEEFGNLIGTDKDPDGKQTDKSTESQTKIDTVNSK